MMNSFNKSSSPTDPTRIQSKNTLNIVKTPSNPSRPYLKKTLNIGKNRKIINYDKNIESELSN